MAEGFAPETLDREPPSPLPLADASLSRSGSFSRLNAKAPEFVPSPRSQTQQLRVAVPAPPPPGVVHVSTPYHARPLVPLHHYPPQVPARYHQQQQGQYYFSGADYEAASTIGGDHHPQSLNNQNQDHHHHNRRRKHQVQGDPDHATASSNGPSEETVQKVLNQVEYYFSDLNLATTDHLMRFISKDPEGYVPLYVVASFKKIKSLVNNNISQLSAILRNSSKLVVSEDGKKVRRLHPFTDSEMEELQSRVIVAENLPEDHCYRNLKKIFSVIGSVKAIRTCQPQSTSTAASPSNWLGKGDGVLYSNKLHAFVEYESVDVAEKAVEELNDEENWRSGLKIRLILSRRGKPVQSRGKKVHDGEELGEEDDPSTPDDDQPNLRPQSEEPNELPDGQVQEYTGDDNLNDSEAGQKKGLGRGRGMGPGCGRGRGQYHHKNNGNHSRLPLPTMSNQTTSEPLLLGKQPPGPRMPDGTKGFSLGRGKPVSTPLDAQR
ncbi:hypothetical protein MLD38_017667 [Melastoma candidum]|uniref:Uncharacterized protein n=1 Tax=Melastoma candidum TaxID=119954 RepID=A0ACB9QRA0_9MYRT|nr:hypothetical protein MLD38_017667 [Melastoma candidum]